jgi:hypothetical protein
VAWFSPDREEMTEGDRSVGYAKAVGRCLDVRSIPWPGHRGEPILDDGRMFVLNASDGPIDWTLPDERSGDEWGPEFDTVVDGADGGRAAEPLKPERSDPSSPTRCCCFGAPGSKAADADSAGRTGLRTSLRNPTKAGLSSTKRGRWNRSRECPGRHGSQR